MFQYQDFESSGNPILIQNETTALPPPIINELHIYGGSYQNKITGSQLLNPSLFEDNKTDGGITYTTQKDGSIIINGNLEVGKNSTFQLGDYIDSLEDGKHYIYKSDSDAGVLNIGYNDGTPNDYRNEVTVDKKRMTYIKCYIQFTQKYPPKKTHLFPMFNEGTVVKPFEPYTGGKTSPSPEIPAEIVNKGSVMTTGKQLWDNEAAMNMDFWTKEDTSYLYTDLKLKPNTTYTLSVGLNNMYKNYNENYNSGKFAFYIGENKGTYIGNSMFGNTNVTQSEVKKYVTFRTSSNPFYFNINLYSKTSESLQIAFTELLQNIMLVEGDQVLPWEPFTNGQQIVNPYAGEINLNVTGKNLIDYTKAEGDTAVRFVEGGFIVGGDNSHRIVSVPFKFKKGESYTVTFKEKFLLGSEDTRIYLPGNRYSVSGSAPQQYGILLNKPFIPQDEYTAIGFYIDRDVATNSKNEITDLCLVKTGMDITYEPYHTPQSLTVSTPNGLPGVPVDKDGNYTDQNGQQWVCDEIDLGRGKYVQRVAIEKNNDGWRLKPSSDTKGRFFHYDKFTNIFSNALKKSLCNIASFTSWGSPVNDKYAFALNGNDIYFSPPKGTEITAEELNAKLNSLSFPVVVVGELATPIERDLTSEEIAAYESIVTHNDTTIISNNENCNMKIKYKKGVIMPKYDSTKLIVQMKALARTESMPIDSTEVWDSLAEAQSYVKEANAYAGQTIKALVNGKYKTYTLQPSSGGYTLEEVGAVSQSDLKQYVQVVERLPESGQQQGVIYIVGTTGQIWTGSAWKVVFKEVSAQVDQLTSKVTKLEGDLAKKAPINNPVFTGKVMVNSDEVAVKSYVDGLISNLVSSAPGVVDGDHPLPVDGYKAGQTWRVALAGTYAGQKCEVGDLIICIKDFNTKLNNADFMVVQANVDGAVTSTSTTSTVGEIVVFNAATGKVIKGSGVNISSLNDAISKSHTHANKTILDSYNKNQTQLLADAAATAQGKVDTLKTEVDKKANKSTTLAGYGITDAYTEAEIDSKLKTITENVNTKVDAVTVDSKIDTAKGEIETAYNKAITEKLAARVGSIPEDTDIKTYVDTAIGSGGTASAEAIAKAKQEAINASKQYTDSQLLVTEF